jgi:hypothetical protein
MVLDQGEKCEFTNVNVHFLTPTLCYRDKATSSELNSYYDLGRLTPYFERPALRFSTPCVSRLPRTT